MSANTKWGAGPWDDEPDTDQWTDEATGLQCYVVRNKFSGSWLGYVMVPVGHPMHGKGYSELEIDAHGGLTYSGDKKGDGGHWLGFDCAHLGDLSPGLHDYAEHGDRYRDIGYVRHECESIARQIKEAS